MDTDYVITTRVIRNSQFTAEPGPVRFLRVPRSAQAFEPSHAVSGAGDLKAWVNEVIAQADGDENPNSVSPTGDILVFVHGYNNDVETVLLRQRQLQADLVAEGWRGLVIAFDWPSENNALNYLEDRSDAAAVAIELVRKCVRLVAEGQARGCETNIHLLGHSTGAYVIMEAFTQALKDGDLFHSPWRIGQVAFIAGDVSTNSLSLADTSSEPTFARIMRLTNYSNQFDAVLAVSNAKRLGTAPRAGRVGLPVAVSQKAVNVNCSRYFAQLDPKTSPAVGNFTHAWHIGDRVFARDLAMTLEGAIDREAITTRDLIGGNLYLADHPRPRFMSEWGIKDTLGPQNT